MQPYLAGNTSGDYNNLDAVKSLVEFVCRITVDLAPRHSVRAGCDGNGNVYLSRCVNVADIGGDSGGATDVVQAQGSNEGISFEQERERLADPSTCAKDSDLGVTGSRRGEPTTMSGKAASGVSRKHFLGFRKMEGKDKRWNWGESRPTAICSVTRFPTASDH